VTGRYRSGELSFSSPAAGPLAEKLSDAVALVEGRAEREGKKHHFRAVATLADIAKSAPDGRVQGILFEEVEVEGDGVVTLRVAPRAWFNLVDFAVLEPGTKDEPALFEPESQPAIAFAQGLAQVAAYSFHFSGGS